LLGGAIYVDISCHTCQLSPKEKENQRIVGQKLDKKPIKQPNSTPTYTLATPTTLSSPTLPPPPVFLLCSQAAATLPPSFLLRRCPCLLLLLRRPYLLICRCYPCFLGARRPCFLGARRPCVLLRRRPSLPPPMLRRPSPASSAAAAPVPCLLRRRVPSPATSAATGRLGDRLPP